MLPRYVQFIGNLCNKMKDIAIFAIESEVKMQKQTIC